MRIGRRPVGWTCVCMAGLAWGQARSVYIDANGNNGPSNWNNLSFATLNASALLVDSLTNGTGIRATVTVRLNGGNNNASAAPVGDAAEFAPASTNNAYGHTVTWSGTPPILFGEMVFSNLNPTVAYTFTFYASRMGVGNIRDARYIVTGANSGNAVLNASNNSSATVTVADIYPDAAGVVTLRVEPGPDNNNGNGFYYITAMKFVYTEPPPTVAYVDANNTGTLAGWNVLNLNSASAATLVATNGAATGIRALVTTPLGNATSWATYTHTGDAAEFAPAGIDGSWAGSGAVGIINLYNLKPSVPYTFTFFACRPGVTDTREATYSVLGANAASNTLDASSNTDQVAVVAPVLPKADGTSRSASTADRTTRATTSTSRLSRSRMWTTACRRRIRRRSRASACSSWAINISVPKMCREWLRTWPPHAGFRSRWRSPTSATTGRSPTSSRVFPALRTGM